MDKALGIAGFGLSSWQNRDSSLQDREDIGGTGFGKAEGRGVGLGVLGQGSFLEPADGAAWHLEAAVSSAVSLCIQQWDPVVVSMAGEEEGMGRGDPVGLEADGVQDWEAMNSAAARPEESQEGSPGGGGCGT